MTNEPASAQPAAGTPLGGKPSAAVGRQPAAAGKQTAKERAEAPIPTAQENNLEELFGIATGRRSVADSSIRVDVDLLDGLMRLVGELVLTRNQLIRAITETADAGMTRTAQRLNLITSELQESVMKTRMQAIEHLWAKLPRVVRDLSAACGKQVRLAMEGRETELDRSLLEAVKDPLTHLVRNAVDHGIEPPAVRVAAGKPAEGVLTLRAYHEGGHVIVEVADDGAGIDPDAVAKAAVQRGLITRDQLAHMERREILASDVPAGLLHGQAGHQGLRPWRRHGCRQDQHRADRRRRRRRVDCRRRHDLAADHPADPGDHPGPHGRDAASSGTSSPRSRCTNWCTSTGRPVG